MSDMEKEILKDESNESEKEEILKFGIIFFSIIFIFSFAVSIVILNMDLAPNDDQHLNGNGCGGCDEDYYYNGSSVMVYKQFLEALSEIDN